MASRGTTALAIAMFVVATATASGAGSACPQVADRSGDVVFQDQVDEPSVGADRDGGWSERSLDIRNVRISADGNDVITTVSVTGLTADAVHGYVWRVWLEPTASRPRERLWTTARRVTGGDQFSVTHEYLQRPKAPSATPSTMHEDSALVTGKIDVSKGEVQVRMPLRVLDGWQVPRNARLWNVYAESRSAQGVSIDPLHWSPYEYEGQAWDETAHKGPFGRMNAPGC
jgi:hypothetical protein